MFKGKVTVVGATGNVGRNVMEMLLTSNMFQEAQIRATSSSKSAGSVLQVHDRDFLVEDTSTVEFSQNEICIFNTESDVSLQYIPRALECNAYVVDSSSQYRMSKDVPLIVPYIGKVNVKESKLFAHSNCIVSPIASVIYSLHEEFELLRVIASTYQSTSGAGRNAMNECFEDTKYFCESGKRKESKNFPRFIPFNVIPQIGSFDKDGVSGEESKIVNELQKIVSENIFISATSVRVPVMVGHSVSLSLKFQSKPELSDVIKVLQLSERVIVNNNYHTPIEVEGKNNVFVSRIRYDEKNDERWFHMWLCSDNTRVGAASDAFYIAEKIAKAIS